MPHFTVDRSHSTSYVQITWQRNLLKIASHSQKIHQVTCHISPPPLCVRSGLAQVCPLDRRPPSLHIVRPDHVEKRNYRQVNCQIKPPSLCQNWPCSGIKIRISIYIFMYIYIYIYPYIYYIYISISICIYAYHIHTYCVNVYMDIYAHLIVDRFHSTSYVRVTWRGSKRQVALQGSSFQKTNASRVTLPKQATTSSSIGVSHS